VLASLIGYFGDFDLAEDAAAEAFAIAAQRWPSDGMPASPAAWLVTTARNRAIDRLRRDRVLAAKLRLLAADQPGEENVDATAIPDERLELIFMCCHPALAIEAQVALTLRAVGGLSTEEIARVFLVPRRQPPVSIELMLNEESKPRNCCMTSTTRCSRTSSTLPAAPEVNG